MKQIVKVKVNKNFRDKKLSAREIAREILSDQQRQLRRDKKSSRNMWHVTIDNLRSNVSG